MRNKIILLLLILVLLVGGLVVIGMSLWNDDLSFGKNTITDSNDENNDYVVPSIDIGDTTITSLVYSSKTCELNYLLSDGSSKAIVFNKPADDSSICFETLPVYDNNSKYYAYWYQNGSPDTALTIVSLSFEEFPVKLALLGPSSSVQDILFVEDYLLVLDSLEESQDPYLTYTQSISVYSANDIFSNFTDNYLPEYMSVSNQHSKVTDLGLNAKQLTSMKFVNGKIIISQSDNKEIQTLDLKDLKP